MASEEKTLTTICAMVRLVRSTGALCRPCEYEQSNAKPSVDANASVSRLSNGRPHSHRWCHSIEGLYRLVEKRPTFPLSRLELWLGEELDCRLRAFCKQYYHPFTRSTQAVVRLRTLGEVGIGIR